MSSPPRAPAWLEESRVWAERSLERCLALPGEVPARLHEAMRYAVLGGGKRLRPALVRLACRELGGRDEEACRPAAAVELVHTYSLVHDDLPAMDDDALRRGRPTVHVAFDEATAILVGDALLTLAFEQLGRVGGGRGAELAVVLARAAGPAGMVGGQMLDLSLGRSVAGDLDGLVDLHERKTAALFAAAGEMGAIAAGSTGETRARAAAFGRALGLLFQAVDDLLDVTGDAATLGKTPGKDAALERSTLVSALGPERTRARAEELAESARTRARELSWGPGSRAAELVAYVLARRA